MTDVTAAVGPFAAFIQAVEPEIRRLSDPGETVRAVEPHLRNLVQQRGWLPESHRRPIPSKAYAQYLLYRPDDYAFSVVSFVWNPLQGSPIHDHCTWGVVGQYEGEEEETRFRLQDNRLERLSVGCAKPGDVSHVYPPNRDIHQILNQTSTPTISIHIYGGDIGSQARHTYDPVTGASRPFVSAYDLPVRQ